MKINGKDDIPYIMENKKMFESTNQKHTVTPAAKRLCELWIPQRAGADFGGLPGPVLKDDLGLSIAMVPVPPAGWFIYVYFMENPIKIDDLGVSLFQETTIFKWDIHLKCSKYSSKQKEQNGKGFGRRMGMALNCLQRWSIRMANVPKHLPSARRPFIVLLLCTVRTSPPPPTNRGSSKRSLCACHCSCMISTQCHVVATAPLEFKQGLAGEMDRKP